MGKRRVCILLLGAFLLSLASPLASNVGAQTSPPSGAGDWTIPTNDVTIINNDQILIQGDIDVYGTLILNDTVLFISGSNNGDRELNIHAGGAISFAKWVIGEFLLKYLLRFPSTGQLSTFN